MIEERLKELAEARANFMKDYPTKELSVESAQLKSSYDEGFKAGVAAKASDVKGHVANRLEVLDTAIRLLKMLETL